MAIAEQAPTPMAAVEGARHIVRYVNPAFCRLVNKSKVALLGKPFGALQPHGERCVKLLDGVRRTGKPVIHTEPYEPESPPASWSYAMWPLFAQGRPGAVMLQVNGAVQLHSEMLATNEALILGAVRQHELTEAADALNARLLAEMEARKRTAHELLESEKRFASIFNQTTSGIGLVDVTGRFVLVNDRFCHLVGRSRAKLMKLRMQDITHSEDLPHNDDKFRALAEGRGENFILDKRYVRPDGSAVWVHNEVAAIRDADGRVRFIVAVVADITERKRLEEDLAKRNADLAAADTAKDHFLAVLSHELRSPLNVIHLWSQILQTAGCSDDNRRKGLDVISRSSKSQARLVEDLLDVHRISTGKMRLELTEVDLAEVARLVIDSMAPVAAEKEIRIERKIGSAPALMFGDPARLQQVLGNLLGNAIKFTPRRGTIRVTLRRRGARAEVAVSDTGEGISAAALPHIFDRFRNAERPSSGSQIGLGLGLAIARQLVGLHGGSLTVASAGPGHGSTFTFSLPLLADKKATLRPLKWAAEEVPVSLGGVLVLVVDDQRDAREAVCHVLQEAGAKTIAAGSADEALETLRLQRPDVILSDIGMPIRDGYDLLRSVRALPAERGGSIPAIAFTAYAGSDDRDRAMSAGFQIHLAKPAESRTLIGAIAALVSRTDPGSQGRGARRSIKNGKR
jgi:PAS domain S-box-containing protein